jgi:hypothetical protein
LKEKAENRGHRFTVRRKKTCRRGKDEWASLNI